VHRVRLCCRIEDKSCFTADALRNPTVSAFGIEARLPIEPSDIITASDQEGPTEYPLPVL